MPKSKYKDKEISERVSKMKYTSDVADGPIMTKGYYEAIQREKKRKKK